MLRWLLISTLGVLLSINSQLAFAVAYQTPHPDQLYEFPGALLWQEQQQLTSKGHDALDFISSAFIHGLNPEDYHYSTLSQFDLASEKLGPLEYDHLLTTSLLDLIHDLAVGKTDPLLTDPQWHIPRPDFDSVSFLQQALLSKHFSSSLADIIPSSEIYQSLTTALSQYRSFAERKGWSIIPPLPLLRPGERHQLIPAIRQRLAIEDPILVITNDNENSQLYDDELVSAVKRFQQHNQLKVDGIIGQETQATINISADQRVQQIKVALERYRWLPQQLGERHLIINLASYQLNAIADNQQQLNMRVIVGQQKRQTPSFTSKMTHIVFNPYWHVPPKLARKDLLPKQQKDPNYFYLNNFTVFQKENGQKVEIDPYSIDWQTLTGRRFPYSLRQSPGTNNALGKVKFMFPNPWDIYLHDTPNKELFKHHQRNFSSGCIRVEDPYALADFSLADSAASQLIQQLDDNNENSARHLAKPLPVYAIYSTVWPDKNGINFAKDNYLRDQSIAKHL